MRHALIVDGLVREVVEGSLDGRVHVSLTFVAVPDGLPVADGWSWSDPDGFVAPAAPVIASLAVAKRRQIHDKACRLRDALIPEYPLHERETWDAQLREAEAYTADNTAPTRLLSAMATARGMTVAALAARVMDKAEAFATAGGAVIGCQQALEDQLQLALDAHAAGTADDAATRAAIAAIDPADPAHWPA